MAKLVWTDNDARQEHELQAETRIGRALDNDIYFLDPMASTAHAKILSKDGAWIIEDIGSTNGTFVNGERCKLATLRNGDVIRIGDTELTFVGEPAPGPTTLFLKKGDPQFRTSTIGGGAAGPDATVGELDSVLRDNGNVGQIETTAVTVPIDRAEPPAADADVLARRLKASYEISKATAATLDLPGIMDRVLAALLEIFAAAERAFILLLDPDTADISSAAVRRRAPDAEEVTMSRTAIQHAMDRREAILCTDALHDARYAEARSVVSLGIRSMMIAPLIFHDELLGAIYVDTRRGAGGFAQPDLELLTVAAGQVAGCVVDARLHEQVVTSERLAAVGQTVAGLAHCIKNILQGIKGGAYILDQAFEKGNQEGVTAGWEMVKRNNGFMEDLVFDLLSFSKQRVPNYVATDLNELCKDVCDLAAARGDGKGVPVTFNAAPDLEPVEIDPTGVRRCLVNLAMNAVDACDENAGKVTVATEPPSDGFARVIISDNGCGMSEEAKAKLFAVFFSTKGSKGTGLGLPVAKKVVDEHGGRIDVESQEGKGTAFTVCLPPTRERAEQKGGA